ncbi:protein O-mannosyl-transferase family [Sphingobacterium sp. BS-2]|uniref:protein O-mannosyl-transferase family n=1 Tax=Sphingobacterium sp. BS-2 TaxID=3377129 RepID=UPI0038FD32EC
MNYKKINNLLGWVVGIIATLTYILTLEKTTSWWDTGEFIASAYKLQIVHQPGAPLFLMIQNLFSNLAMGDNSRIAYWMNVGSAVCSGLTITFLFWTITALAKKAYVSLSSKEEISEGNLIKIMGAGVVGALAYTFSDTFWFSAVESEVYAMSSLCTAVVFWAILKWEAKADEPGADRWLILIAYVMGLSIGVHLLNLLVIPAIALVIYFRRTSKVTGGGIAKALIIGVIVLAVVLWGVIQYLIKFAAFSDLFFVNSLGMGFGTGATFFTLLVAGLLLFGIWYSWKNVKPILNISLLSLAFVIFGYSSFTMILVRAKANPTLNNSDPDNVFTFLSYLNREQYGDEPLLKGRYFDAKPTDVFETGNIYRKDGNKYVVAKKKFDYTWSHSTLFPRIYSDKHESYYREFLNLGPDEVPTMVDNLKFFFGYQIGQMYSRYFMWNFVGRQNDQQGQGSFTEGNWISGIKPIDNVRLGGQYALPTSELENAGRNTYFFLPLILGILGAMWQFKKQQRDASVVTLLFFFTGLAIVLYLNQTPLQPRERDYAYAGSFYAFCIWVGMGVIWIADLLSKKVNAKNAAIGATAVSLLAGPVLLASQNWDDHDRSEKFLARDMAKNYLESCAPNAILFSYGDNDTYPLWYVQEVEGFRTDVRVVNLSLLSADWYMKQMMHKVNDADALPLNIDPEKIKDGVRDVIYFSDMNIPGYVDVEDLLQIMLSDDQQYKVQLQSGDWANILPTKKMQLKVDKQAVIANKVVPKEWEDAIVDTMQWNYSGGIVSRADLSIMALLANNGWKRPIYFTSTTPEENMIGLEKFLVSEGFAMRLMPVALAAEGEVTGPITDVEGTYNNIINKFTWGNIANSNYLDPDSYRYISMYAGNIFGETAQNLLSMGKNTEAKKLVNNAYENLPKRAYLMSEVFSYTTLIDAMYKTGEVEKANEIVKRNLKFLRENMAYYMNIAETKPNLEFRNMRFGLAAIQNYQRVLTDAKQQDLLKEVNQIFETYRPLYEAASQ